MTDKLGRIANDLIMASVDYDRVKDALANYKRVKKLLEKYPVEPPYVPPLGDWKNG